MSDKRVRLPREGLVEPEQQHVGPGEQFIDGTDVEGHSWVNPAPPVDFGPRTPSTGGELVDESEAED